MSEKRLTIILGLLLIFSLALAWYVSSSATNALTIPGA